jgi:uncharacterized membrane protein
MHKGRLEAFSDGVLAIIITIMVLELKLPPHQEQEAASLADLQPLLPVFLAYVLSFVYLGIYWNNHHHMLQMTPHVNGGILWANLHLLFWLSLIPFTTDWLGESHFQAVPAALYGAVLLLAAVAYFILQQVIVRSHGGAALAAAIGRDFKGKISPFFYAAGIGLSFLSPVLACVIYALVALMWLIPDPRIERQMSNKTP